MWNNCYFIFFVGVAGRSVNVLILIIQEKRNFNSSVIKKKKNS